MPTRDKPPSTVDLPLGSEAVTPSEAADPQGTPDTFLLASGKRLGRYQLDSLLSSGPFTEVWLAVEPETYRLLAIKGLKSAFAREPALRERLLREATAAAQFGHPHINILCHYEPGDDENASYIVYVLVEGARTLALLSQTFGPLPPPIVALFGCVLGSNLYAVHAAGFVHTRPTLDHWLIDPQLAGRHVLVGLSAVVQLEPEEGDEDVDEEGLDEALAAYTAGAAFAGGDALSAEVGSDEAFETSPLQTRAPEQLRGEPVSIQTDVYVFCCGLYQLLTGVAPFTGETREELLAAIEKQEYVRPRDHDPRVTPLLAEVIERGLRFEPEARWSSLAEAIELLATELRADQFAAAEIELQAFYAKPELALATLPGRMVYTLVKRTLTLVAEGDLLGAETECRRGLRWNPRDRRLVALLYHLRSVDPMHVHKAQLLLAQDPGALARRFLLEPPPETDDSGEAHGTNGHGTNGHGTNGHGLNGNGTNGHGANGHGTNDHGTNGHGANRDHALSSSPGSAVLYPPPVQAGEESPTVTTRAETRAEVVPEQPPIRRRIAAAVGLACALGLLLVLTIRPWAQPGVRDVLPRAASPRLGAIRPDHPDLAPYTPYPVDAEICADSARMRIDLGAVERLRTHGDLKGVAAAWSIDGSPGSREQALATYDQLAPPPEGDEIVRMSVLPSRSPDIDSDRAGLLLCLHQPEKAFHLTEGVLAADPQHSPGQWNHSLTLQSLGLVGSAITAFQRIGARGEPGWSREALARAQALQKEDGAARHAYDEVSAKGRAMVQGGPVVPEIGQIRPGYARVHFYDAVRAATSVARLQELQPLAVALDRHYGGDVLERYLQRIAQASFEVRAPLARTYAQLAANYDLFDAQGLGVYLGQLRAAGQDDLILGALILTGQVRVHLDEYRERARRIGDPWLVLIAENEAANAEMARGEYPQAEERLGKALAMCQREGLDYRCAWIEHALVRVYLSLYALPEAEAHAKAGLQLAHKTGIWEAETTLLRDLGEIAYYRNDPTLSLAFTDEAARRDSNGCVKQRYAHEARARAYFIAHRFEDSRRELLDAPLCNQPRTLWSLILMASANRTGTPVGPPSQLREGLDVLRRQGGLSPGEIAYAEYVEGLLVMERDPQEGRMHFQKAIDLAEQLPPWDADAHEVRLYSYEELIIDAAKNHQSEEAWVLLAEQRGLAPPRQCALGVLVANERTLVLLRDAQGVARLHYEARRASQDIDASRLVPELFKTALQNCSQVAVHADPLLEGRTALLPPQLTWSFLEPHTATTESGLCPYRPLLITDVPAPEGHGLPPLDSWDRVSWTSGYRVVQGLAATPSAALREMHQATRIIVNAQGSEFGGMEGVLLSPGEDKKYLLTPVDLLQRGLACAPITVWIGGDPGGSGAYQNDIWRVAAAAVTAGARASFTVRGSTPKGEVPRFFGSVFERIDAGTPPAKALRDVRMIWIEEKKGDWVKDIALSE